MNNHTALRMLWCSALIAVATVILLLPNASMAEDNSSGGLYHWVDEQGRRHFSDRPPEKSTQVTPLELRTPPPIGDGQNVRDTYERLQKMREAAEQKRQQEAAEIAEQKMRRDQQMGPFCQQARRDLAALDGRVVYRQPDGSARGVPLQQVAEDREKLQRLIQQQCN